MPEAVLRPGRQTFSPESLSSRKSIPASLSVQRADRMLKMRTLLLGKGSCFRA
jgi:hypothetical protein